MTTCHHESLEFVGEQRTDEGINAYYRCKACSDILVVTPSRNVIGIKGVQPSESSESQGKPPTS